MTSGTRARVGGRSGAFGVKAGAERREDAGPGGRGLGGVLGVIHLFSLVAVAAVHARRPIG